MQIPPPSNWQDFETLCCDLWRAIWNDPNTQQNGRLGQQQHGVDISGRPTSGSAWAGVQCKGKDNYADKTLTEAEVKAEVEKAKHFKPQLSQYIIATTGPKDANVEQLAREITVAHISSGLFSVTIWSWADIVSRIEDYPEIVEKHYPGFGQNTKAIRAEIDELGKSSHAILEGNVEIKSSLSSIVKNVENIASYTQAAISTDKLDSEYQAELDSARDLLNQRKSNAALALLDKLKDRIWPTASSVVKFRLLTNSGAAYLSLGQEKRAAALFLEALQYNPEDEKALSNASLGHMLIGSIEEAKQLANKVLAKNPANNYALSLIVQTSSESDSLDEIINKIPEAFRSFSDVSYAIGHIARKKGDLVQATYWFGVAVDNEKDEHADTKGSLGSSLLEQVGEDLSFLYGRPLPDETRVKIESAIQLLTTAWDLVADTDLRKLRLHWIVNRAVAYRMLGKLDDAIRDVEVALAAEPINSIFIRHRALLAHETGDSKKAIELLRRIQSAPETPEVPLLLSEILYDSNQPQEAIQILLDFLKSHHDHPHFEDANRLLLQLYLAVRDAESAAKISATMRASQPASILNLVDAAKIAKFQGDSAVAVSLLQEADKYITDSTTFRELLTLANELFDLEQHDLAARLYSRMTVKENDSPLTRRLLYSYYRSGKMDLALQICQELRRQSGPLRFVSEIESVIYEEIGDLRSALQVGQEYLRLYSDDFSMKLRNAVVNLRLGNLTEVDKFLEEDVDIQKLSFESCFQMAVLYSSRANVQKAFEIIYEARRIYYNNGVAHMKYMGFFFGREKEADSWLNMTTVGLDAAVCIEDENGEREWFIIERRKDADIQRKEINSDHSLAKRLLGKTVGDNIVLRKNQLSKETGKIVEIKSKYVYALHESMSLHEKLFPDVPGMWRVRMGPPSKEGELPEGFQTIFDEISRQHDAHLKIARFYKEGQLTVGAFAKLVGRNVIDAWGGMISTPDLGIKCSNGSIEERTRAVGGLTRKPKLIIDIISLMTIQGIGAEEVIAKTYGKLGIAQATLDLITHTIAERKHMQQNGFMTIGKEGDQFVRQEISAEVVKNSIEYLETLLQWFEANCDVLPCNAALKIVRSEKQKLDELIGEAFIDTVLIASEPGRLLFSDDERLRGFAKHEYGVDGVWTQVLLMHCLDSNLLERKIYNELIVRLAASYYHHTSIDADILIEAARQSKWAPSGPYTTVLQVLSGTASDEPSALNVAANFLYELWKQPILSQQRDYLILALLDAVTSGRNRRGVISKIAKLVKGRFLLLPLAERQILSLIELWKRMHLV